MASISEVMEKLRRIDRANYTHFIRLREIKRRSGKNHETPFFKEIVQIYLRSGQIADALIKKYSSKADRTLAYSVLCKN
jgi:hypothetical protein